jgi:hypothetical protein
MNFVTELKTAYENFIDLREMVPRIRNIDFPCTPNLGMRKLRSLNLKSEGMSGDILTKGFINLDDNEVPIVIKFFKIPCSYKTFVHGNRNVTRSRNVDDKNQYEIGNTLLLTDKILLNGKYLTHHITFAFASKICTSGYETTTSMCNPNFTVQPNSFLIPADCEGKFKDHPQCAFQSDYMNHELDDTIRYLVVEMTNGDLEQWILIQFMRIKKLQLTIEEFDYMLLSLLMMIAYTLYILDDYLQGFVHGDLGPRNILYSECLPSDKYWKYQVNGKTFYIKAHGIVPKLWDFSTTHIGASHPEYFDYISKDTHKNPPHFKEDLSILFNKISSLLQNTNSQVLNILNDIIPYHQQMTNCDIAMEFLSHKYIIQKFCDIYVPDNMIENTISYS